MSQAVHLMPGAVEGALAELRRVLGAAQVVTDRAELEFHSQDVYRAGELPAALIRPSTTEQLAEALRAIAPARLPIVPRGGGMSYTDGYLPKAPHSIMIDLLTMDRVEVIDAEDCFVTVQC
ncbi:MAG: FAD-binding oxidoreductase, partial [Gammaproteobacteria bacterium]